MLNPRAFQSKIFAPTRMQGKSFVFSKPVFIFGKEISNSKTCVPLNTLNSQITEMASNKPSGPGGQAGGNVINLMTLSPQQLDQLRQQIEQELNFYQQAVMQLKDVQNKMNDSATCLKALDKDKKDLLVPLTASLFVRGEVEDSENVLIDIGTGYYVEKSIEDALDYFKRKVDFLSSQIEKVQSVGREKSNVRAAILEVMESKLVAMQQQAGGMVPPGMVKKA